MFSNKKIPWELLIVCCALFVRLLYLLQSKNTDPLFYQPIMDAQYHHEWAKSIVTYDWLGNESFFRAPLYPYFLALIYKIVGINLIIPRIVQIIIGAVSCLLTLKIGTHFFGKNVGIIAGFIAVLYPLFIYFDNEFLIPNLLVFLILTGFYLIVQQTDKGTKVGWFLTGVVWGLAAITRPNVLLFVITIPFWLLKKYKKKCTTAITYGIVGVIVMIAPVTIRNYIISKEFVPIAWQGGTNFYIGNNPHADGKTAIIPGTRPSWWGGFYDAKRIAEQAEGKTLKNAEIDRYWLKQGLNFFATMPGKALTLLLKKTYLFFGGYEISNNRDIYYFTRPTYLKFLLFKIPFLQFPFGVLLPLSLVGLWFAFKKKKAISLMLIFIITYSFSFIIFFVCARYRLPIIPFLIILSSFAITTLIQAIKNRAYRRLIVPLVIFIASCVFFNANISKLKDNPAINYLILGEVEYRNSHYNKALSYLKKALPYYSHDGEVMNQLGACYYSLGQYEEAIKYYLRSIEINPHQSEPYDNIGSIYYSRRQYDTAKNYFLKAIEINPKFASSYYNIGSVYFAQDSLHKALHYYKQAINLNPNLINALFYAGVIEQKLGNSVQAKVLWERVLSLNPQHQDALYALRNLIER
jgi:4-amino-4-deoxy-L-arabinose transferase-like glycosyltransferase